MEMDPTLAKQIVFTTEARRRYSRRRRGNYAGPKGRNVAIDKKYGAPILPPGGDEY